MREHFRGVIRPREQIEGPAGPVYRYAVVGMLVTDRPLDVHPNETAIDGPVRGLAEQLVGAHRVELLHQVGDATGVLVSLETAWPDCAPT